MPVSGGERLGVFGEPERGQCSSFSLFFSTVPGLEECERGYCGNWVKDTVNTLQITLHSAYMCSTELTAIMNYTLYAL